MPQRNRIVVGRREDLAVSRLEVDNVVWRGGEQERVSAMVRYRMEPQPALATRTPEGLTVVFDAPLYGVAPGQAVVCYRDDLVIGGGTLSCAS